MDYTSVFKNSGRILWRHKLLLGFGLLLAAGSLPGILISHLYMRFWLASFTEFTTAGNPEDFLEPLFDLLVNPAVLIGGAIVIFLIFTLVWIITTVGEASLIQGVADFDDGRSRSFGELLSAGAGLLVRFIAIDTVIFLPLFLILLALLLILGLGLIGSILFLIQPGANPNDLLPIAIIVALVSVFLAVLTIPVTILTMMFRLVAFRSAVLEDLPTRPSIRRAWELIRAKIVQIIVVVLLLYAVGYAVGMITSVLILPISFGGMFLFIGPMMQGQAPQAGSFDGFLLLILLASIVGLLPSLVYRVFSSAVWTITYREWQRES